MKQEYTFQVINFGCPVNQYEARALESAMEKEGFRKAEGAADIYIINSCVVTASAAAEARRVVRNARKENPRAFTVMTGCYPQVYHRDIVEQLPEVDLVIGTTGRSGLPGLIRRQLAGEPGTGRVAVKEHDGSEVFETMPVESGYHRTRPVVKVQEGCDEFCTYCIIARARGRPRSAPPQEALRQVQHFVELGYREIILAGNHLGIYGKDIPGWDLVRLVQEVDRLPGDFRVRLNYLEPMDVQEELLAVIAESRRVCPHLYLPLQSGSDRVLRRMGRKYSARDFRRLVLRARELIPGVSIFTDLIAGFPGETGEDHRRTLELVEKLQLSSLHVFSYSPRPGTPAAGFKDNVRPDIKKRRVNELREKGQELAFNFHSRQVGEIMEVLPEKEVQFEGRTCGEGVSANNLKVRFPAEKTIPRGEITRVEATRAYGWGLMGKSMI